MTNSKTKRMKDEIMQIMHLTRPPRLEGAVKNAMMDPVRKKKTSRDMPAKAHKAQGYTEAQRKDYQLKSRRHL